MKVSEKQHMQRTWGSPRPGMPEAQQGGSGAWSRVRGAGSEGRLCGAVWATVRAWAFTAVGMGALEGCRQR